jgi:hypothetical protein
MIYLFNLQRIKCSMPQMLATISSENTTKSRVHDHSILGAIYVMTRSAILQFLLFVLLLEMASQQVPNWFPKWKRLFQ